MFTIWDERDHTIGLQLTPIQGLKKFIKLRMEWRFGCTVNVVRHRVIHFLRRKYICQPGAKYCLSSPQNKAEYLFEDYETLRKHFFTQH